MKEELALAKKQLKEEEVVVKQTVSDDAVCDITCKEEEILEASHSCDMELSKELSSCDMELSKELNSCDMELNSCDTELNSCDTELNSCDMEPSKEPNSCDMKLYKELNRVGHRSGTDAFTTGFCFTSYALRSTPTDVPLTKELLTLSLVEYCNKLALGGKPIPLLIARSQFINTSLHHKSIKDRISMKS